MIDFHTHILPKVDDGSDSSKESCAMLKALVAQGVDTVALTPHFYAEREAPDAFLRRRARAMAHLRSVWTEEMPRILLGAEVYYFRGCSRTAQLEDLRMKGSRVLLLEMPFCAWGEQELNEVIEICSNSNFVVLLAHVDRYWKYQKMYVWDRLLSAGAMMQANAECFLDWRSRGKAVRMMRNGYIHVLGTDCHSMKTRRPRMDEAVSVLERQFGTDEVEQFMARSEEYLEEWSL